VNRGAFPASVSVKPLIEALLLLLMALLTVASLTPNLPETFPQGRPGQQREIPEPPGYTPPTRLNRITVEILKGNHLRLNRKPIGNINNTSRLQSALARILEQREQQRVYILGTNIVDKAVFIKARKTQPYGDVKKVIDAVKSAGAAPVGLVLEPPEPTIPAAAPPVVPADGSIKIPQESEDAKEAPLVSSKDSIVVSVKRGDRYYLGANGYDIPDLRDKNNQDRTALARALKTEVEKKTIDERVVYIKADVDAGYDQVVRLIDFIRSDEAGGANQIGLVAERKRPVFQPKH
jgi:biopolymer transport protein ExbD